MKNFLFIFFIIPIFGFSQVTVFEAEKTTDRAVVEKFIADNPRHPAVPKLQQRAKTLQYSRASQLAAVTSSNTNNTNPVTTPDRNSRNVNNSSNNTNINTSATNPVLTDNKATPQSDSKKTADMLTHLFDSSTKKNEAAIQFVNKSTCPLKISLKGKKSYTLEVAPNSQNFIIVSNDTYRIQTPVCDAIYDKSKIISSDMAITIKAPTYVTN